ncbi:hypothetical protein DSO57_1020634 [Entomophthora muscae]|uniref:Uncharacterized protein n=1 Tax=Entomophthora muscae TaxID=34485 RepID=A0ACC2S5S5_9FUNG|nr:hypothetical protein DSO57_1020634 [Entomophthora muscae]
MHNSTGTNTSRGLGITLTGPSASLVNPWTLWGILLDRLPHVCLWEQVGYGGSGHFRPWVELWALIYLFQGPDSSRPSFKKQQGLVHPPASQTLAGPGSSSALGPAHQALIYCPDVRVWSPSYPPGSPLALIPGLESWAWTCPPPS